MTTPESGRVRSVSLPLDKAELVGRDWCQAHCHGVFAPPLHRNACLMPEIDAAKENADD